MKNQIHSEDIDRVLSQHHTLCNNGFEEYQSRSHNASEGRQITCSIHQEVEQIRKAVDWLRSFGTTQSINHRHTSYSLKNAFELDHGYISNGAMIVAASLADLQISRIRNSPNARFNLSEKALQSKLEKPLTQSV